MLLPTLHGEGPRDNLGDSVSGVRELKQRDRIGQEFHSAVVSKVVGELHVEWPRAPASMS